jgi:hypothetical protein
MQPELIISSILFALVGVIVSMDVAGLTLSKTEEFCRGNDSPLAWSLSNAFWHAGLLGLYVLVISGILTISPEFIEFVEEGLSRLWTLFPKLPEGLLVAYIAISNAVGEHLNLILGMLALVVVWRTYSAKIISRPDHANIDDLPILARTAFNIVDLTIRAVNGRRISAKRISRFIYNQAQAALVAIDMLALAILLKSIKYIESPVHASMAVGIVWVVVFAMTLLTTRYGINHFRHLQSETIANKSESESYVLKSMEWVRVTLKLAEPFLVFYFALQLISMLLLGRQTQGISFYFGAGLLVWALVDRWTLAKIIESSLAPLPASVTQTDDMIRPLSNILHDLKQLALLVAKTLAGTFLSIFVFALFLWLRHGSTLKEISFDAELSYLFTLLGIISAIVFFPGFKRLARIEDKLIHFLQMISANRRTYIYMIGALFIADVFPIYNDVVENVSRPNSTSPSADLGQLFADSHLHALQVGIWLAYFFVLSVIIDYMEQQFAGSAGNYATVDATRQDRHLRKLYGILLTLGSALLGVVGWFQQLITT